jgi:uncharacterized protein (TIGR02145 family)
MSLVKKTWTIFGVLLIMMNSCKKKDDVAIKVDVAIKDFEGNIYNSVKIGTQIWLVENLKTTFFNDGTPIPEVADNAAWFTLTTPGYCWYDNNKTTYNTDYGALYNWYTVNTGKLCPSGWHVPTRDEWDVLVKYTGIQNIGGGKLKEVGMTHWISPNTGATNETGFTALPGGYRDSKYYDIGNCGYFWSSTGGIYHYQGGFDEVAWYQILYSFSSAYGGSENVAFRRIGYSVRCLKN